MALVVLCCLHTHFGRLYQLCNILLRVNTARTNIRSLVTSTCGSAKTIELLLVTTVTLLALSVAFVSMRDAIIAEIADFAGGIQDVNQDYDLQGAGGHSAQTLGMQFADQLDFCDSVDDASGSIDNCITVDYSPIDEGNEIDTATLSVGFSFDDGVGDNSPEGNSNNGTLVGGAMIVDGELVLDGDNDAVTIGNSSDINLGIHGQRSIAIEFVATEVTSRQVIYEEGGTARGLNIYIEGGRLYVGGWNIPNGESGWAPTYVSTPVTAGVRNSVALVLDGTATVQPGALTGYLNGAAFGTGAGSQLWQHGAGIGIGGINGQTIFHTGPVNSGSFFGGTMDNFYLFNRALSPTEVQTLAH